MFYSIPAFFAVGMVLAGETGGLLRMKNFFLKKFYDIYLALIAK